MARWPHTSVTVGPRMAAALRGVADRAGLASAVRGAIRAWLAGQGVEVPVEEPMSPGERAALGSPAREEKKRRGSGNIP